MKKQTFTCVKHAINISTLAIFLMVGSCAIQIQTFKIKKSCVEELKAIQEGEVQIKDSTSVSAFLGDVEQNEPAKCM